MKKYLLTDSAKRMLGVKDISPVKPGIQWSSSKAAAFGKQMAQNNRSFEQVLRRLKREKIPDLSVTEREVLAAWKKEKERMERASK